MDAPSGAMGAGSAFSSGGSSSGRAGGDRMEVDDDGVGARGEEVLACLLFLLSLCLLIMYDACLFSLNLARGFSAVCVFCHSTSGTGIARGSELVREYHIIDLTC